MSLAELGWDAARAEQFKAYSDDSMIPARVAWEEKNVYLTYSECGELTAQVSGAMVHSAETRSDFPAVGDWVAIRPRPEEGRARLDRRD